jgi:hypothetical protein
MSNTQSYSQDLADYTRKQWNEARLIAKQHNAPEGPTKVKKPSEDLDKQKVSSGKILKIFICYTFQGGRGTEI